MPAAIITGAAAGNGLAIARRLRSANHFVVALDRSPIPREAADIALTGDVLDAALMASAYDQASAAAEGAVYLVNNAGITRPGLPQQDEAWESTIDVNLTACLLYTSRCV